MGVRQIAAPVHLVEIDDEATVIFQAVFHLTKLDQEMGFSWRVSGLTLRGSI